VITIGEANEWSRVSSFG